MYHLGTGLASGNSTSNVYTAVKKWGFICLINKKSGSGQFRVGATAPQRQERLRPFVSFCSINKAPRFNNNNKHHPAEFEFQTHNASIQSKYVHTIFGTHLL